MAKEASIDRRVKIFSLASFLNDLGSDMIYPVWPLFVTTILGANMAILGLLDGLGDALVSISQALSGYWSDKIRKRKIFIWIGYLFGSLSRIGYSISKVWQHAIPFRIIDRSGKIRDAPRDAIIADLSNRQNRGKHFGFLETFDKLGAVFGITLCIALFALLGYKKLFLLAAVPSIIAALLIIFFIKEKKKNGIRLYKGFSLKNIDSNFRLFIVLSAIFALGSFSYSFLLIYAKQFGFQVTFIPILYLIFTLVASLISIPSGKLADKFGRKTIMVLSIIFWIITGLTFIFIKSYAAIILSFIFYGIHIGSLNMIEKTFVSELADKKYRASSLGAYNMIVGLCSLPASLLAGIFWDKINPMAPFIISIGFSLISLILLIFVKETK